MTQPRQPEQPAACAGKERMTASVAKRIAAQMRRRGATVDSFKCCHCGGYHLGSHLKADQARRVKQRAKGQA